MITTASVFDTEAARYDAWFDTPRGRVLFANELAAIRVLWRDEFRPALEIGVGTGRFAAALGIEHGVDPAPRALLIAAARGVEVTCACGETLPFADARFGAVLLVATLCFAENPAAIFREASRVLRENGALVVADIPSDSAWGRTFARKRAEGHPFYRSAKFYAIADVVRLLTDAGFAIVAATSTLSTPPEVEPAIESPRLGIDESCGFVCLLARRTTSVRS